MQSAVERSKARWSASAAKAPCKCTQSGDTGFRSNTSKRHQRIAESTFQGGCPSVSGGCSTDFSPFSLCKGVFLTLRVLQVDAGNCKEFNMNPGTDKGTPKNTK